MRISRCPHRNSPICFLGSRRSTTSAAAAAVPAAGGCGGGGGAGGGGDGAAGTNLKKQRNLAPPLSFEAPQRVRAWPSSKEKRHSHTKQANEEKGTQKKKKMLLFPNTPPRANAQPQSSADSDPNPRKLRSSARGKKRERGDSRTTQETTQETEQEPDPENAEKETGGIRLRRRNGGSQPRRLRTRRRRRNSHSPRNACRSGTHPRRKTRPCSSSSLAPSPPP